MDSDKKYNGSLSIFWTAHKICDDDCKNYAKINFIINIIVRVKFSELLLC